MKVKILISIILVLALSSGGYFLYLNFFPQSLLNPFSRESLSTENFYSKLEEKIIKKEPLQLDKVDEISSLESIPRYLAYNPKTRIIYSAKNQTEKFSPASFTKLLTSQVALDLVSPDTLITATSTSIDKIPTTLGLKPGEQLTAKELIRAAIVTSANDAAATLAEGVASSFDLPTEDFIALMNRKASLLGMKNSHFANPEGYDDPDQYSTLEDIVLLVDNLENYPQIASVAASDRDDLIKTPTHGFYYLPNWNGLLGVYPGVDGLKIAYTEEAGYGSIVTAQREGVGIVAIVSGTDSVTERDLAAATLLDQAFIKEKIAPANITKSNLQVRYKQWSDLSAKIKQELEELKKTND